MKRKVVNDLIKLHQGRTVDSPHSFQNYLCALSYQLANDMIQDITRPFRNVCIHGKQPQLILPLLQTHNRRYKLQDKQCRVTLVDYLRSQQKEQLLGVGSMVKEIRYVSGPDSWIPEENCFDLVISSLQSHHWNSQEEVLKKYETSLKPDGALVGTTFVEGTLRELYWAYLLAENQRYGGMSPKVFAFPSLGQTGTHLTNAKFELITILQHEQTVELPSFVDLLTLLQELGESGYLRGRRKGVFEDLLLAAAALYETEWRVEGKERVGASLAMSKFIGWKYHQSQPKKLRKGQAVGSVEFVEELRKHGEVDRYLIDENSEDPKKVE